MSASQTTEELPRYSEKELTQSEVDTPAFESPSDLVIGIDFGTTFTGVAYGHTATVYGDPKRVAEGIVIVKTWPSVSNHYAEKTPSIIAYNEKPATWGGKVRPEHQPQVAHFKLGLQEDVGFHYQSQSTPNKISILSNYLNLPYWKHPALPEKSAVDYAADYLTCVMQHVTEKVLPSHFGNLFLQNQQVSYVLTVPAIWSEKAKALTREAAVRAGIPEKKLTLITEPEAAALYCLSLGDVVDLQTGDRFLVCDAGGGTVVSFPTSTASDGSGSHLL